MINRIYIYMEQKIKIRLQKKKECIFLTMPTQKFSINLIFMNFSKKNQAISSISSGKITNLNMVHTD